MDTKLEGKFARLPDGQRIRIETFHPDGYVSARRVEGEFEGLLVVCAITKLQADTEESDTEESDTEESDTEESCAPSTSVI
jgi:hypothetical protein